MNTTILVLLCLAIGGRELYIAFDRKRQPRDAAVDEIRALLATEESVVEELEMVKFSHREHIARLESAHADQHESLRETDARIRSLISQINDRMLPEINTRLARQQDGLAGTTAELARIRRHLRHRLDQAIAVSLGGEPVDMVIGTLGGGRSEHQDMLTRRYERCAERYGLVVELADPVGGPPAGDLADASEDHVPRRPHAAGAARPSTDTPNGAGPAAGPAWQWRYYLSGRSPRELERDFIGLIGALRAGSAPAPDAACALLRGLRATGAGAAQIGPLIAIHTPESLLCGVLPLAELRHADPTTLLTDPRAIAARLNALPAERFCDLSAWSRGALTG